MKVISVLIVIISLWVTSPTIAQSIPSGEVISIKNLSNYLNADVKKQLTKNKKISVSDLAHYFREKFSERYFYNWKNFNNRFETYKNKYPSAEKEHSERALDHMTKYAGKTSWKLPFNYLSGAPVNAYALRHLSRQHKMVDIAFNYYYQNKDPKYISYFKSQEQSLNAALKSDKYEKIEDGNGVYEAFRSGYRVLNWMQIHTMFLGENSYTDEDQLKTIATLLQHGANLFEHNQKFSSGNHQTRGLSALAMISILLRDFEGTDKWYNHAMNLLEKHLTKEVNEDGFQFERTVHYHISDIGNYFYVYQLAKINKIKVGDFWERKLKSMFTTLVKIAYPDKSAPVLSDDTNEPWAEKNDISGALTLGYLLFDDPEMGYFATNKVDAKTYWYLSTTQLEMLNNIEAKKPDYKSLNFPITGYYVMRDGWNKKDNTMIISAGLDSLKPDHQHGDILGIQAMANGKIILPNYQVRYYLKDLEFFKNSMTKNVALVDNELQGKKYTSNKGGSGFGKFKELPKPTVIKWKTGDNLDVFIGSHDGFENVGVTYSRQVIYLKKDFWIVKDNFKSDKAHEYKQVWQGHYSYELSPKLIRSSFDNGSGLDIYQLNSVDKVTTNGKRGKQWSVISTKNQTDFSFITIVFPFNTFDQRIDENQAIPNLKGWKLNASKWKADNKEAISLTKGTNSVFFSVKQLVNNDTTIQFDEVVDVMINADGSKIELLSKKEGTIIKFKKGVKQTIQVN